MGFQFEINEVATVGEAPAMILGRSEYADHVSTEKSYYVQFVHPQTKMPTREWFVESQLGRPATN